MKKIVCALLTFYSIPAFPAEGENTPAAIPNTVDSGWNLGITVRGEYHNNQGCKNKKDVRFDKSREDYQLAQSIIMTALVARKPVQFYVNGCLGSFAKAEFVKISNGN